MVDTFLLSLAYWDSDLVVNEPEPHFSDRILEMGLADCDEPVLQEGGYVVVTDAPGTPSWEGQDVPENAADGHGSQTDSQASQTATEDTLESTVSQHDTPATPSQGSQSTPDTAVSQGCTTTMPS